MEKINYISRKEESFWKILGAIFAIIDFIAMIIFSFSEKPNAFFWLLATGCLGLSLITNIPRKFGDKDVSEIRKRIFSWTIVLFMYLAIATTLIIYQSIPIGSLNILNFSLNITITLVTILFIPLVFFLILELYKTKIRESHTFFRYLVDEKPAFWKKLFQKDIFHNSYPESILGILFFVLLFGVTIAVIIWGYNK